MARVKRGVTAHVRHKKVLLAARGFRGRSSKCFRPAIERLEKALAYAYRDRKNRKREFRALWIQRINAAARSLGMKYSELIAKMHKSGMQVDRKILSKLAVEQPDIFAGLVEKVKAQ